MTKLKNGTRIQHTSSSKIATPAKKLTTVKRFTLHENLKGIVAERFHATPLQIRLTETENGLKIPQRVQLFKTGTFKKLDPETGKSVEIKITRETLAEIIKNFHDEVRGIDLAIDFGHRSDEEAAGWIKNLTLETHGHETQLWAEVDWTPDGKAALSGKRFRYLSPDFAFAYTDNETSEKFGATLFGAGLTNRPVIKNMAPAVELTEVEDMAKKKTTPKSFAELIKKGTKEELEVRLSEETDEEKKETIQHRLDEMSDSEVEADASDDSEEPKKKDKKMTYAELEKQCQELTEKLAASESKVATQAAEVAKKEKKATFDALVLKGVANGAQEQAFMEGDTIKFAELATTIKTKAIGDNGKPIETATKASDEIITLSEKAVKDGVAKPSEAASYVLKNNPELEKRYIKEMGYEKAV